MDRTERLHPSSPARNGQRPAATDLDAIVDGAPPSRQMTGQARAPLLGMLGQDGPGPLGIAWRDRWLLLAVALVLGAATYVLSMQMPPVYSATTTLAFPYTGSEIALTGGDAERSRSLRTEAERVMSIALLDEVAQRMRSDVDAWSLRARVTAVPATSADVISVQAVAPTPDEAVRIADEVAAAYRRQVDQRQERAVNDLKKQRVVLDQRVSKLQEELAALLQEPTGDTADSQGLSNDPAVAATRLALEASVSKVSDVQARLDQANAQHRSVLGRIQILQPAVAGGAPDRPRPARDAATVILLALMVVGTIRWWRAEPDPPKVDSAETVEAVLEAPVISEIPPLPQTLAVAGVVVDDYPHVVDAYRMVAAMGPVRGSVLVTAARPDAACSDLVVNVGAVLDRDGYQVLLAECDPQAGRVRPHRDGRDVGITDFAAGMARLQDVLLRTGGNVHPNLLLVPWGSGRYSLPRGDRSGLTYAMEELRAVADLVLIDGPPLASSADALSLAANVDGILVVVSTGTPLADLSRLRARLRQLDRPVIGVVVQHMSRHARARRRRGSEPISWQRAADALAQDGAS
jgi:Mrp family chromosome partitioning ATPase